jgi:hypothetical protein
VPAWMHVGQVQLASYCRTSVCEAPLSQMGSVAAAGCANCALCAKATWTVLNCADGGP